MILRWIFGKKKAKRKKFWIGFWPLLFLLVLISPVVNWLYHFIHKPSEILSPLNSYMVKTPEQTWNAYRESFEENATEIISADFLAALAYNESAGNPVAQTYWRWKFSVNPFEVYSPASSSVGMFQITEGTFQEAKKYCIHNGRVVRDGPWYEFDTCWFNSLYSRLSASDSIEMTSARLHALVSQLTEGKPGWTTERKQELAAVIHLCGFGKAQALVRSGRKPSSLKRCGDHSVQGYVSRIKSLQKRIARLKPAEGAGSSNGLTARLESY